MLKEYKFRLDGIAGEAFVPDGNPSGTAIYCNGFPGSTGNNELVEVLGSLGIGTIAPQYPGVYDSDGKFSVESAIESIRRIATLAEAGLTDIKRGRKIPIGTEATVLAGHSFGSYLAARAAMRTDRVRALVLLAPILSYRRSPDAGVREDGVEQLEYVQRSRPHTYRLADLDGWRSVFAGDDPPTQPTRTTAIRRVAAITGANDSDIDASAFVDSFREVLKRLSIFADEARTFVVPSAGHDKGELLADASARDLVAWAAGASR